jgi:hypothetical protein
MFLLLYKKGIKMERTAKFSEKGKGQASSGSKPADFIKRGDKPAEQSHRGNKPQVDQKSLSSQESKSNPKESKTKPQKYRTFRPSERSSEVRRSSQQHRNAGQERRRLQGGGDDDTTSQQQSDQERYRKISEGYQDQIKSAGDYLKGLNQDEYNAFNAHKHGYSNEVGERIAKEYTRRLNGE